MKERYATTRLETMLLDCKKQNLMREKYKISPVAYVVNQTLQQRRRGEVV